MNQALLSKWKWRFLESEDLLWARMVVGRFGYSRHQIDCFPQNRPRPSSIWTGIIQATRQFSEAVSWSVGDGRKILFWHDHWLCDAPLKDRFPSLFEASLNREDCVQMFWQMSAKRREWVVRFRGEQGDLEGARLQEFARVLKEVSLSLHGEDRVCWRPKPR
ncbi:hypothetical protein QJS10_CPB22g00124 [Acorus calamus]|uniref:Uncharacterized protein n=1 Tax=Acorus calamus TaxID=4465 RepID=A0AAV9BYZ5_ACOCL|nr:hypothetical protein QJS10_CPB22g00124 [Acorus calamus]